MLIASWSGFLRLSGSSHLRRTAAHSSAKGLGGACRVSILR